MKWKEKKSMNRNEVASLLKSLGADIEKAGALEFEGLRVILPRKMQVEVEYKSKHGKNKFEIGFKWMGIEGETAEASKASSLITDQKVRIASTRELSPRKVVYFTYPTSKEKAALIVMPNGELRAYSMVCPHKGEAITWDANSNRLHCPSHGAVFDPDSGSKIGGPGRERLRRIKLLVEEGQVYAVGIE